MKRSIAAGLLSCLIACGAPSEPRGTRSAAGSEPIPPEMEAQIHLATTVGRILHAYDRIAAEGTDVMRANADDVDHAAIGGYLVEHDETGWFVVFFTKDADPQILARIAVNPGRRAAFKRVRPAEPATGPERTAIRALRAAIAAVPEKVQPLNPIVLSGADAAEARKLAGDSDIGTSTEEKSVVYLLAGTQRRAVAVLGRHYRALARADGTIEKIAPMSKGVIEIPTATPAGSRDGVMGVTHTLGDSPTEAHVFASLLYRTPIIVITTTGQFVVDGERITTMRPRDGD